MVDLMMWLVIAALLLATAIQGIGYYQKNAYLYQMKNDAVHGAEVVSAKVGSADGKFTTDAVAAGVGDVSKTGDVTLTAESGASDANGYVLRATHPGVSDLDVLFLSAQRGAYAPGVHVVPKGTVVASDGGTTIAPTPGGGTGGTTAPATADTTSVMTTVWDTSIAGCSNIVLPLTGHVNTTVNWGDGTAPEPFNYFYDVANVYSYNLPNHTYAADKLGPTTITIDGTFDNWVGPNWDTWSTDCITKVTSWGDGTGTKSAEAGFFYTTALTEVARIPSTTTTISSIFSSSSFNGDVSKWDTSNVTDMSFAFSSTNAFNGDVSNWNTGNTTNMHGVFQDNTAFNGDISKWNTSKVTNMQRMFSGSSQFNGNISNWNTGNVTTTERMFSDTPFNGDISSWNTGSLTSALGMFSGSKFNGDVSNWNMSNVTDISAMFLNTPFNGDLSHWNVSNVKNAMATFQDSAFNNNSLSGWDMSHVESIQFMFSGNSKFNGDISNWNTSHISDMGGLFYSNTAFNGDISRWDTSNVGYMGMMFSGASAFNQNIGNWNVSNAYDMQSTFENAAVFNQDLTRWTPPVGTNHTSFDTGSALTTANLPTFR